MGKKSKKYNRPYEKFSMLSLDQLMVVKDENRLYNPEELLFYIRGLLINTNIETIRNVFAYEIKKARRSKKVKKMDIGDGMNRYIYSQAVKHILNL